ncbi:helix-turn-helix domain-containing protein [Burkholderia ubonensis]|uniref:helix-turn-helix domain-containing protein n=1 Tax=Burkholderia ubonensis TaxID=101571 RepID=UPI0007529A40|nr:helix-turn-helix transcriptional regulator [Burkholderia ubonensis]KVX81577.1 XRE family transcriptional regulator [Burkholderia ubonensis]
MNDLKFSERLKVERKRLRMNQTTFAVLGGITKDTQLNYEHGSRRPDSAYLEALAAHGVDIAYLLTGQRNESALSTDEEVLLAGYRALDAKGRAGVLGMIAGMTQHAPIESKAGKFQQNFSGANIGQHISANVVSPFTLNVGSARKKRGKSE